MLSMKQEFNNLIVEKCNEIKKLKNEVYLLLFAYNQINELNGSDENKIRDIIYQELLKRTDSLID